MPIRVRYRGTDLTEGVVEVIEEANGFEEKDNGSIALHETWVDEDTGKDQYWVMGSIAAGRWESVVNLSSDVNKGADS